ncbi:NAD(P)H-hydrate dehydratase [Candidatus Shapirobacteria bacterium CG10_big_fil_rev_8_21_14_0_10_38_8]|nr:MAG: NAD(P)H-hydrate dehydratase [Candidatus Shapirobacteria bacterium CG10_big_fil_rev_8_21_14_0_10_38_8]
MKEFIESDLKDLYRPNSNSSKTENCQVTIIGGSSLFHGAPIAALKVASRVVDMVFFSSPEPAVGEVASQLKSQLTSFIWVPWNEAEEYIKKSNAILIGPGFLRYHKEAGSGMPLQGKRDAGNNCDSACRLTKQITESLFEKFPDKQWVIDAGSLQTMNVNSIPKEAILTPNKKEFRMLFGEYGEDEGIEGKVQEMAKKYNCIIVYKTPETIVCSPDECVLVKGGNAGLTKGNTGDVVAGLTAALAAQNEPFFAACAASWIVKKAADELYEKVGFAYNSEDLILEIPEVLGKYFS